MLPDNQFTDFACAILFMCCPSCFLVCVQHDTAIRQMSAATPKDGSAVDVVVCLLHANDEKVSEGRGQGQATSASSDTGGRQE